MPEGEWISRTDTFIAALKKRPLWSAAGAFCMICLTFLSSLIWNLDEARARAEAYNAKARTAWMTGRKLETITKTLTLIWSDALSSHEFYSKNVEKRNDRGAIPRSILEEGLVSSKNVQGELAPN